MTNTEPPTTPRRVQRQRAKGWLAPAFAIYVGRPTMFGNPFPVDVYGREGATDRFRRLMLGGMSTLEMSQSSTYTDLSLVTIRNRISQSVAQLRGRTLMCWCPLDAPCHADVLLEIANAR